MAGEPEEAAHDDKRPVKQQKGKKGKKGKGGARKEDPKEEDLRLPEDLGLPEDGNEEGFISVPQPPSPYGVPS